MCSSRRSRHTPPLMTQARPSRASVSPLRHVVLRVPCTCMRDAENPVGDLARCCPSLSAPSPLVPLTARLSNQVVLATKRTDVLQLRRRTHVPACFLGRGRVSGGGPGSGFRRRRRRHIQDALPATTHERSPASTQLGWPPFLSSHTCCIPRHPARLQSLCSRKCWSGYGDPGPCVNSARHPQLYTVYEARTDDEVGI
ncbi:hypothetical protein AcV5_009626 [Taiwanofungus camphoratus]|nr:hypothetical protein AcV5_009626 [Antrodia cinnamomea]